MELATTAWMMLTDWQQVFEKLPQDLLLMLQIFPFCFHSVFGTNARNQ